MFQKITVKGNAYDRGKQLGRFFSNAINRHKKEYLSYIADKEVVNNLWTVKQKLDKFPEISDEIKGRADGANIGYALMLLMMSPEIINNHSGCTTVFYKKNDCVYFSHNEDDNAYSEDEIALVRHEENGKFVVGLTPYNKLTGSCFSYNSYGLVFSCNYLFYEDNKIDNISRYIFARRIINSQSINEVKELLKDNRLASPSSFNILDTNTLECLNIENDYEDYYLTNIDKAYARSNHFLNRESGNVSLSSLNRYKYSKMRIDKLDDNAELKDVYNVLCLENESHDECILMDPLKFKNTFVTIANFSIDSYTKVIEINDYLDHTVIKYRYNEF